MFYEPFRIDISYTWKHTWYLSQMSRMSRMTLVYVYDHCQMHNRSKAFSTLTHSTPLVHSRSWHYCHIMYAFLNWTCGFFSQAVWSLGPTIGKVITSVIIWICLDFCHKRWKWPYLKKIIFCLIDIISETIRHTEVGYPPLER